MKNNMIVDEKGQRFQKGVLEPVRTFQSNELQWLEESYRRLRGPRIYLNPSSEAYRERQQDRKEKGLDISTVEKAAKFTRGE